MFFVFLKRLREVICCVRCSTFTWHASIWPFCLPVCNKVYIYVYTKDVRGVVHRFLSITAVRCTPLFVVRLFPRHCACMCVCDLACITCLVVHCSKSNRKRKPVRFGVVACHASRLWARHSFCGWRFGFQWCSENAGVGRITGITCATDTSRYRVVPRLCLSYFPLFVWTCARVYESAWSCAAGRFYV